MKVSIIIVNYHVKKEVLACINSIYASRTKVSFEIIVVDNDERKTLGTELKKKFPKVVYVQNKNNGFGEACNVGARHAKGDYIFFLNPDTEVFPESIDSLVQFLEKKKNAGIVAPLLLGKDGKAYQQGTKTLNPLRALFSLSFIHKMFPTNSIAQTYLLADWDRKTTKEVDVAPGTAFMMKTELFKQFGGFDEKFFLFFEEFDLCKRVREAGYTIFIYPKARVTHAWGVSTNQRSDIQTIFEKSRFYYFKKHFGLVSSLLTESFLRFSKYTAVLLALLGVGLFLRMHNLYESMAFIGDQGWYYLSARDMVQIGTIPLVGIESSRPWLHQGALWTYILGFGFWLFGFSPFVGAYISICLGMLAIVGMYWLGSELFSRRVGIIAAALFATSPFVIASDRMPYHTSPIPLVTILFIYCLYRWLHGNVRFFPLVIALLGLLYNLELATALLGITTMVIWLYGYMVKKNWAREVLRPKLLVLSLIAFVVSMLPMLLYDVQHGFPQTLGFTAWLGYKLLLLFGFPPINPGTSSSWGEMVQFIITELQFLIFAYSGVVAVAIFIGSMIVASFHIILRQSSGQGKSVSVRLILIINSVLLLGLLAARTPSHAYLPMMFPGLILLIAVGGKWLIGKVRVVGVVGIILLMGINAYYSFVKNSSDHFFQERLEAAKYIVKEAGGKEYNLRGKGPGSQFESFTMNYEYVAWWLGNGPTDEKQPLQFIINEEKGIRVEKRIENGDLRLEK